MELHIRGSHCIVHQAILHALEFPKASRMLENFVKIFKERQIVDPGEQVRSPF